MKGLAMMGIGKIAWVDKTRPTCGPMDAICRPIAVAPCTSDIHTVWAGALGDRHELILGHEAVGEVLEVGSEVKDFKVGDRVLVPAITPDWNSLAAEFFHVNDADGNLALVPEGMDLADACMLSDMVPTGCHGVELADIEFGDKVVVIGIGPVGLMSVAAAAIHGASQILAIGSRPNCVALAKEFGATDIIDYHNGDIAEQVISKVGLVDRVIIAGGNVDTFAQAIKMLKAGGKIGNVNYLGEGDSIKIPRVEWGFGMAHKQINGGLMPGGRLRMEKLASMVTAGRIHPGKLVTHRFEGLNSVEEALLLMKEKPKDLIKPLVIL